MADRFTSEVLALIGRDLLRLRLCKEIAVQNPAPGADWNVTVPGGVTWEIVSISARLTTSAVVAARFPQFRIRDSDSIQTVTFGNQFSQAASLPWTYTVAEGANTQVASGFALPVFAAPSVPLTSGWTIGTATGAIDAGDQWSNINLVVREWDETAIIQEAQELFTGFDQYIESGYSGGSDY